MKQGDALAAGLKALPGAESSFANTQAVWRFLNNPRVTLPELAAPLLETAWQETALSQSDYALVAHDWSRLHFGKHESKQDRLQMTHNRDVGYELQSSLLICAATGIPIAPVAQNLVTVDGSWSTREAEIQASASHLDELSTRIDWLEQQPSGKKLVHIVDREADSIRHLRDWRERNWLIRAKAGSKAKHGDTTRTLKEIADTLDYRTVEIEPVQGTQAVLRVAETRVVFTRPGWMRRDGKRAQRVPGEPLMARLIVSRLESKDGKELAFWTLLSNLSEDVPAEQLARWYSWRWRIETFFKVLKGAGHQVESWLQQSGSALAKRLLVASQACVLVWRLMRRQHVEAVQARQFLARLSGRQLKRGVPESAPALLAGLFSLLQTLELLEHYSPEQLRKMAQMALGIEV